MAKYYLLEAWLIHFGKDATSSKVAATDLLLGWV